MNPADHARARAHPTADTPPAPAGRPDPGLPQPVDCRLGPRWRWGVIGIFLGLIGLPAVLREATTDSVRSAVAAVFQPGAGSVVDRLRAAEARIDDGVWTDPIRAFTQSVLFRVFGEGNRTVVVGRDGWLFHRPGVQALTGRGPVLGPTFSVAQDPALKRWDGPLPVIREFASQLRERGIRLLLLPVPDKAALWSSHLAGGRAPSATARLRHPDWPRLAAALGDDVEVVDLTDPMTYLRDDTHWDADGARAAAVRVADAVRGRPQPGPPPTGVATVSDRGDLVGSLGLVPAAAERLMSSVLLPTVSPVESDESAPTVVLGDSNVNMFDDGGLPFHHPGAGFGSWLQAALGEPLHVIAINGGGATQVRQRFAALPDDVVRQKKTVIWVLAERDLWMDPSVARANSVEWKRVVFNPHTAAPPSSAGPTPDDKESLVIEATLRAKSRVLDPASVNYPDAVFTAEFSVDRVVAGRYTEAELAVVLWNFRQRVVQPTARLVPGQRVRLTLVPWLEQGELTTTNLEDDFQRFDLPLLYAEKAEVLAP